MVHLGLAAIIKNVKEDLLKGNLQDCCYYFLYDKGALTSFDSSKFGLEDQISCEGYKGEISESKNINELIQSKPKRGIHYSNNIFTLIGIYLQIPEKIKELISEKFNQYDLRYKFLITKFLPEYTENFLKDLDTVQIDDKYKSIFKFLFLNSKSSNLERNVREFIDSDLDLIDLIILEELQNKFIHDLLNFTRINLSSYDVVKMVLENFSNSIKKVIQPRREGHASFTVKDEYDIQDLLYIILKSIFPNLIYEEQIPKIAGKGTKVEFVIKDEGIMIEAKMIKENDSNETKFIKELKEDLESYHTYPYLRELIFYVYDPFNKTKDKNNFSSLEGNREKKGQTFNVTVVYSN